MRGTRGVVMIITVCSGISFVNYLNTFHLDNKAKFKSLIEEKTVETEEVAQPGIHVPPTDTKNPKKPLIIILLSSSGRSGSTLLSNLLITRRNSVLFFEPLYKTMNHKIDPCHVNGTCVAQYLKSIAKCDYSDEFEDWFKRKKFFYSFFNLEISTCLEYATDENKCIGIDIRSRCRNSSVRIIKVIRCRVAWIEDLLKDDSLNIKVIYLTRDPRGTLASYRTRQWENSPSEQCTKMEEDMRNLERFAKLYPGKTYHIHLERLSVNLQPTVEGLFEFLYGNREIYDEAEAFIDKHMRSKKKFTTDMNIVANSSVEYQAWRWEITEDTLKATENDLVCQYVFKELGHTIFGSLTRARDKNVALLNYAN
ncbi:carbohydrate sulfotransferase 1-like [Palaemon carinicauda]|uniref:carbohydrate sulfotransferase 1-like n=1 Tax=Palaemon carinicauda TaxID=392227 RepID=UPI0035B6431B